MTDLRIFVFGASSMIAKQLIEGLSPFGELVGVSRSSSIDKVSSQNVEFLESYSEREVALLLDKRPIANKTLVIFCNGITDQNLFYKLTSEQLNKVVEVNLTIPLSITKIFLKKMPLNEIKFIYLSSTRAELGDPGITLYSATKGALTSAAKVLSLEYGRTAKYFFVISMGLTNKGLIGEINSGKIKEMQSRSASKNYVDLEELTRAVLFLKDNISMNGSVLYCDNGYH